jgi:hypothetical protein
VGSGFDFGLFATVFVPGDVLRVAATFANAASLLSRALAWTFSLPDRARAAINAERSVPPGRAS